MLSEFIANFDSFFVSALIGEVGKSSPYAAA